MTKKNKNHIFREAFDFVIDTCKSCKIKTILVIVVCVIALITGIIVAIRTHDSYSVTNNYGVIDITQNDINSSTFFTRLLSMLLVFALLLGSSYNNYTFVIGIIFLGYRAYLLGLNVCLMIVLYGFSGVIVSFVVAFPCQLLTLFVLGLFFICMSRSFCDFRTFGGCRVPRQKTKVIVSALVCLILLCLLESIMLTIFSAKIIFII